ncbi:unnamed protein product [Closterium sp. NIES-54]
MMVVFAGISFPPFLPQPSILIPHSTRLSPLLPLQAWDVLSMMVKAVVFGGIIADVSCGWGMTSSLTPFPSPLSPLTFFSLLSPPFPLQAWDVLSMMVKAVVFGGIIADVSCGWGMTTQGGAKGVGESTTAAVVISPLPPLSSLFFHSPLSPLPLPHSLLQYGSNLPVLVFFHASWSGPSRMVATYIDQLAPEYAGRVACYKVDTDLSPETAMRESVGTVPYNQACRFKGICP